MDSISGSVVPLAMFQMSPQIAFMRKCKSHWLHLFDFSPLWFFKKQIQPIFLCILSGTQFEDTFENAQWGKSNKCNKCDFASSRTHMLYQNPEKYRYLFSKIPVSVFESNPGIPKGPAGEVKWRCADWRWFKCPFVISTGGTRWRSQGRQDDWTWGPPLLQGQNWGDFAQI